MSIQPVASTSFPWVKAGNVGGVFLQAWRSYVLKPLNFSPFYTLLMHPWSQHFLDEWGCLRGQAFVPGSCKQLSTMHFPIKPTSIYLHKPRDQFFPKHQPAFKDVQKNTNMSCSGWHSISLLFWDTQFAEWRKRIFKALCQARPAILSPWRTHLSQSQTDQREETCFLRSTQLTRRNVSFQECYSKARR